MCPAAQGPLPRERAEGNQPEHTAGGRRAASEDLSLATRVGRTYLWKRCSLLPCHGPWVPGGWHRHCCRGAIWLPALDKDLVALVSATLP